MDDRSAHPRTKEAPGRGVDGNGRRAQRTGLTEAHRGGERTADTAVDTPLVSQRTLDQLLMLDRNVQFKCIEEWVLMIVETSGRRAVNTSSKTSWMKGATQYCESTSGVMPHSRAST